MEILTWNCNGALRKKFQFLKKYNADINVIQECENPSESNDLEYQKWAKNYLWIGDSKNKGLGVFVKDSIQLEKLNWSDFYVEKKVKHFLPCKINNDFELLAVWTHQNNSYKYGYIGQLWKYLQINQSKLKKSIIIGDFNSNKIWDKKRRTWNHSDVVSLLKNIEIESLYHLFFNQEQGSEKHPTFFLQKNVNKSYHIDYIFTNKYFTDKLLNVELGNIDDWIHCSDHIPIICKFNV